jgi:tetratricopeptide (TPR) repeat protein
MLFFVAESIFSQQKEVDSLSGILNTTIHDTTRLDVLNQLIELLPDGKWEKYNDDVRGLAERQVNAESDPLVKNVYKHYLAIALNNQAVIFEHGNNIPDALLYLDQSLKIQEELGDRAAVASILNNMGAMHVSSGNLSRAQNDLLKSLKISEALDDKAGVAQAGMNLSMVYAELRDYDNSYNYLTKSISIYETLKNKSGMAYAYSRLGLILTTYKHQFTEARSYLQKAYQLFKETENKRGMAEALTNLGLAYTNAGKYDTAVIYDKAALELRYQMDDKKGIANNLANLTYISGRQKKYAEALEYGLTALEISRTLKFPENLRNVSRHLYSIYKQTGRDEKALEMHELYTEMRDSISNKESRAASMKKQLQYEYERKSSQDSIRNAENILRENLRHEAEIKHQQLYTYGGGLGFLLMLVISVISFKAYRTKQKANKLILEQKELVLTQKLIVQEKQREIVDSIHYAKRIQSAIIPSEKNIQRQLEKIKRV